MDICTTIIALCKDNKWEHPQVSCTSEDYEQINFHDGNPNNITVDQIKAKQAELKTAYENAKYQRDRKPKYKSWEEQLDMMYHSMDDWKAHVKAVKDAHPKP